jgi:hypothetical protein
MVVGTLAGAAVGAIFGSLGTHILQIRRERKQEQQEISNLRDSLIAELSCMDELLQSGYDDSDNAVVVGMSIPSGVYESNSNRLSILTQEEVEKVIRFYSAALKYQKMVEEKAELFMEGASEEDIQKERSAKSRIREEWVRCVVALLEESATYPDAITFEGRRIAPHKEMQFEDLWIFLNHVGISEKGMEAEPINN